MFTDGPERSTADEAARALLAAHAFAAATPGAYQCEPTIPEGMSLVVCDLITGLLHLADATGVQGDREELTHGAYLRYREEAAYERIAELDPF
ncbi:hypothetical protein ACFVXG_11885 [Kitasatospora sp. NPDC058162]|uniref:Uncharacterized protein n=1 Tax=Streptomyces rubellomurinus (strain ATCC 31215) TaxID=359131 RepID=A0A0F2T3G7_STRR3|nr:hypothetical protein [Streptomyces rubellomurinus]KJS57779.1 hypothetical protein VM95_37615 [Streptomyces rubellomurinus]